MTKKSDSFSIRLTKSRLEKGLLAIPKKHADLFPDIRCDIDILFDDSEKTQAKKYVPDNAKIKENRIFALGTWFIQHEMKPNDRLTISVINQRQKNLSPQLG